VSKLFVVSVNSARVSRGTILLQITVRFC